MKVKKCDQQCRLQKREFVTMVSSEKHQKYAVKRCSLSADSLMSQSEREDVYSIEYAFLNLIFQKRNKGTNATY